MNRAIHCQRLFDGETWHRDRAILVAGEDIVDLVPAADCPAAFPLAARCEGVLAPGLIDLQVNGGGGIMLNNDPSPAGVDTIAAGHRATGTTAMMPTVISDTPRVQRAAVAAVMEARDAGNPGHPGYPYRGPLF